MAFLVRNYHDQDLIYNDTSKVEWSARIFENDEDGAQIEVQRAGFHPCDDDDYNLNFEAHYIE